MVDGEAVTSTRGSRSSDFGSLLGAWSFLGWVGVAFLVVGGFDFLLTFVPARFGNPEWEFGTVTSALNGVPVPLLGATLLLLAAWANESVVGVRLLAALLILWGAAILGLAVIYGLTLPLAMRGFADPNIGLGLKRAIARSLVQLVVYPLVMLWLGVRGLRLARSITS